MQYLSNIMLFVCALALLISVIAINHQRQEIDNQIDRIGDLEEERNYLIDEVWILNQKLMNGDK